MASSDLPAILVQQIAGNVLSVAAEIRFQILNFGVARSLLTVE
jgi:hypothetical protein